MGELTDRDSPTFDQFQIVQVLNAKENLFDFDHLHKKRQELKNEIAEKKAYSHWRARQLVPFETYFTKKSCLDFLSDAKEFLGDEEVRVKKTPAGFNRPRTNNETRSMLTRP